MTAGRAPGGGLQEDQARLLDAAPGDEMFEVVNLAARRTGLAGTVYVSTAQGRHEPRIKWFPGRPARDAPCLIVTLEEPPRTLNAGLPAHVAREAEGPALAWARANRAALLHFSADGLGWDSDEVQAFIDGLSKLP